MKMEDYKVGDIIEWCDEKYRILKIYSDNSGKVETLDKKETFNMNFNFCGERAKILNNKDK